MENLTNAIANCISRYFETPKLSIPKMLLTAQIAIEVSSAIDEVLDNFNEEEFLINCGVIEKSTSPEK